MSAFFYPYVMIPPQFICFDFAFIYAHDPREAWCGSVFMQVDVKHSSDFMGIVLFIKVKALVQIPSRAKSALLSLIHSPYNIYL